MEENGGWAPKAPGSSLYPAQEAEGVGADAVEGKAGKESKDDCGEDLSGIQDDTYHEMWPN